MIADNFQQAMEDYQFLLNRGYTSGAILKMVSNRRKLSANQRAMLYRGVFSNSDLNLRAVKIMVDKDQLTKVPIHIDGLNVLITVASYLQGITVFVATDGFLRDVAQLRGRIQKINQFDQAVELTMKTLRKIDLKHATFYLDKEVEMHKDLSPLLLKSEFWNNEIFELAIAENVDGILRLKSQGVVCTSDTGIIDNCGCSVFDLPAMVLKSSFNPHFIDLGALKG